MSQESIPPASPAADWYADPYHRFQLRYWDGEQWTQHVSTNGQQTTDPVAPPAPNSQVQEQVQRQAQLARVGGGGGSLFTEPILVVNQKAKFIEVNNEYAVYDQNGAQLGAVREVGQTSAKKFLRVVSNLDQLMTHTL